MSSLQRKRILVTRPRQQAHALLDRLAGLGAVPVAFPVIAVAPVEDPAPLDAAIASLDAFQWVIFTSANGVEAFWERLAAGGKDGRALAGIKVAAIGPVTRQALLERGVEPCFVPQEYVAEAIVAGMGDVNGQRILLPRADIARQALADELQKRGALPTELASYRTQAVRPAPAALAELRAGVDVVTFTSSSTVRSFVQILEQEDIRLSSQTVIACIGPITATTACQLGLRVDLVAEEYTSAGLVEALVEYFEKLQKPGLPVDESTG